MTSNGRQELRRGGENDLRLTAHDERLTAHDERLTAHDECLTAHDERLKAHDKCLTAHGVWRPIPRCAGTSPLRWGSKGGTGKDNQLRGSNYSCSLFPIAPRYCLTASAGFGPARPTCWALSPATPDAPVACSLDCRRATLRGPATRPTALRARRLIQSH